MDSHSIRFVRRMLTITTFLAFGFVAIGAGATENPSIDQSERQGLDIPSGMAAIEAFSDFVEEHDRMGYADRIHRYTYDGAQYLIHAVSALVPKGEPTFEGRRDALMRRVEQLEEGRIEEGHMLMLRQTFVDASDLLTAIQEKRYPAYEGAMRDLRITAQAISPDQPLNEQAEGVHAFYQQASSMMMEMAGQPAPPLTAQRKEERKEKDAIGGGPMMSEEVSRFVDFVDANLGPGTMLEDQERMYEGLRLMIRALSTFMPTGDTFIEDQREALMMRLEQIEATRESPAHERILHDTFIDAARMMSAIQERRFPKLAPHVRLVRESAEHLDSGRPLNVQGERLESFFLNARRAMEDMEEARQKDPIGF
ncbi:MAG: hypothetical protein ACNA8W_09660 [Bradymonadaceae bacterium]